MKPALLALSFLLFAFITNSRAEPVLDLDGDAVRPGAQYYIVGSRGGLRLAKTGKSTCPVDVIQDSSKESEFSDVGKPLVLQTISDIGIIPTDTQVKVTFADTPDCAPNPSKWILALDSDSEIEKSFVRLGMDRPIYRQVFKIMKNEEGDSPNYKFVYCPGYIGVPRCFDVGIRYDGEGIRHLAAPVDLHDVKPIKSFNFVLQKASDGGEAEIKMKTAEM